MFSKRSASIFSFSDWQRLCFFGIPFKCWSPTVPPQWPISLLFLCLLNKFSTLWGARWRRGFRTTTPLYSIPSLSSVSLAPSFFFFFYIERGSTVLVASHGYAFALTLSFFPSLSLSFIFKLPYFLSTSCEQCYVVPSGLIRVRSRLNTLRHILMGEKNPAACFPVFPV